MEGSARGRANTSDAHYEALRRAYDERVKSLSRKLHSGLKPGAGGSGDAHAAGSLLYTEKGGAGGVTPATTAHPSPADFYTLKTPLGHGRKDSAIDSERGARARSSSGRSLRGRGASAGTTGTDDAENGLGDDSVMIGEGRHGMAAPASAERGAGGSAVKFSVERDNAIGHAALIAAHANVHVAQEAADHELIEMREERIDTLVEKCAVLQSDKAMLALKEKEAYRENDELKRQLDSAANLLQNVEEEKGKVQIALEEEKKFGAEEREYYEKTKSEAVGRLNEEIMRISDRNAVVEDENKRMRMSNEEHEKKIEGLFEERQSIQNEVIAYNRQQAEVHAQLQESQLLLRQSEAERQELRNQYLHVGEKFEKLMDLEEKENSETIKQLNARFKLMRTDKETYKSKTDQLIVDMEASIKQKESDYEKLTLMLEDERNKHQQQEQTLLEAQRKTLQEHNLGLQKLSEMMPIASHQQILNETRTNNHAALLELETSLRNQYETRAREQAALDEKKQKEFQETLVHVRAGLKKLEAQRDEATSLKVIAQEESATLKSAVRKLSLENKDLAESKHVFASSLEEANKNLSHLRSVLEDEKAQHLKSVQETQDLKHKLRLKDEYIVSEKTKLVEDMEKTIGTQLEWAEQETDRLVVKNNDQVDELDKLRNLLHARDSKMIAVLEQKHSLENQFSSLDTTKHMQDVRVRETLEKTKAFIETSRKELHALKDYVCRELRENVETTLYTKAQTLTLAMAEREREWARTRAHYKEQIQQEAHAALAQKQQYLELLSQQKAIGLKMDQLSAERDAAARGFEEERRKTATHELNLERFLTIVSSSVPNLDGVKDNILECVGRPEEVADLHVKSFRDAYHAGFEAVRSEMRNDVERLTKFELRRTEERYESELVRAKESLTQLKTDYERKLTEQELEKSDARASVGRESEKASGLSAVLQSTKNDLDETEDELKKVLGENGRLEEELGRLYRDMDEIRKENEVVVEIAKTEAAKPLKEQLKGVYEEAESLQKRFQSDLKERDQQWELMFDQVRADSNALISQKEKEFKERVRVLDRDLEVSREREHEFVNQAGVEKRDAALSNAHMIAELDTTKGAAVLARNETENLKRELKAVKEAADRTQKTMQEALSLKTQLATNLQLENKRLVEEREYEITKLTELKEDEFARLQSEIKRNYTFSDMSVKPDEVFSRHADLTRSADDLSRKVHEHLASANLLGSSSSGTGGHAKSNSQGMQPQPIINVTVSPAPAAPSQQRGSGSTLKDFLQQSGH